MRDCEGKIGELEIENGKADQFCGERMEREEEANEAGEVFGPDGGAGSLAAIGKVDQAALSEGAEGTSADGNREDVAGVFFAAVVWVGG